MKPFSRPRMPARVAAFALAGALLLVPAAASAQEPAACATLGQASAAPIVIEGIGPTTSAPFRLDGGAYQVDWSMTPSGVQLSSLRLEPADAQDVTRIKYLAMTGSVAGRFNVQTFAYNVKPGSYALDVHAPGRWSVTFTPISV